MKTIAWSLLLAFGLQLTACKSKTKTADTTTTTTVTDTTTTPPVAPVEIYSDADLKKGLDDAVKDYPGVKYTVDNGVVTLTDGPIKRDRLPNLMTAVQSLHPKNVVNKLIIQ